MNFISVKEFFTKITNWIAHPVAPSMTEEEVNDFIDDLNRDFRGSVDWIVEEGISDFWTYRKWNSGIAECWGSTTIRATSNTVSGQLNFSESIQVSLPFEMSDYAISAICGNFMMYLANYSRGETSFSIRLGRISTAVPTTSDTYVLFGIKGRWK